jgi:hypothetical protein
LGNSFINNHPLQDFMYARLLRKAAHVRRFTIRDTGTSGWQVLDEQDAKVVKSVLYDDWHRVERARAAFALEAATLREAGWIEGDALHSTNR